MFVRPPVALVLLSLGCLAFPGWAAPNTKTTSPIPPPAAGGGPSSAPPPAPVYCGSFTCFTVRVPFGAHTPSQRASMAMDIINKYLGGAVGKVTVEPRGRSVRLLLNRELLIWVTVADSLAEKMKSPAALAQRWAQKLSEAFQASKARP